VNIIQWILSNVKRKGRKKSQSSAKWGFYCAIITLERPITSSIGAYRIVSLPAIGSHDIILTLDYLPKVQLLEKYRDRTKSKAVNSDQNASKNQFRFTLRTAWHGGNNDIIFVADLDLLGNRQYTEYTQYSIREAFRETCYNALNISHYAHTLDMQWQQQINRVNWLIWLEIEIKYYLNDENHSINPIILFNRRPNFF